MPPGVRFLPSPGAAKEPNYNVNALVDFWSPAEPDPKYGKDPDWNLVARLNDRVTPQRGQGELAVLAAREAQSEKQFEGFVPQLQSLKDEMNQDGRRILLPLLGAAALVLLISCGNAAALLLVRGLQRQQEYAVRSAMGMGRIALLRQVSAESLLFALLGGVFGMGLAFGAVKLFKVIAGHAIPRLEDVTAGWAVLAWGLGAAVVASMFAGVFPALRAFRLDPMEVLKNAGPKGTAGLGERRLLRGVTMSQTALTLALLVGAGLLIRTMINIAKVPSGYNTGHILTMSVTEVRSYSEWANFHHRLNPGAHGFLTPEVEIPAGPGGGVVVPEALEVFFEQIGTNGLQVIAEEIAQAELLLRSEIGFALEDAPTGLFEERFVAILGHLARLGGTYIVEGRIHLGYDVKTVENVECL
jgi:putative ABC transport system permease protein